MQNDSIFVGSLRFLYVPHGASIMNAVKRCHHFSTVSWITILVQGFQQRSLVEVHRVVKIRRFWHDLPYNRKKKRDLRLKIEYRTFSNRKWFSSDYNSHLNDSADVRQGVAEVEGWPLPVLVHSPGEILGVIRRGCDHAEVALIRSQDRRVRLFLP